MKTSYLLSLESTAETLKASIATRKADFRKDDPGFQAVTAQEERSLGQVEAEIKNLTPPEEVTLVAEVPPAAVPEHSVAPSEPRKSRLAR